MPDLRIAIVGSFSTGKTTLAEMAASGLGLPLLPEVAREIVSLGFELDHNATVEAETLIFLRQLYNEMVHPAFVGDRSLIDSLAYAEWVLQNQPRRREFALWDACLDIARYRLRGSYTHVFYLPIEFAIVPDGLRPMDPQFQADIDGRIVRLLKVHDIPYSELRGDPGRRLADLRSIIGRDG